MAKSKENTTVNENERVRFALYTDESTMELVDKHYKEDGCGCKSEYITVNCQEKCNKLSNSWIHKS